MTDWELVAWQAIAIAHDSLPKDATLKQRKKALRDAYPFGRPEHNPYKVWLKCRRRYLSTYESKERNANV